MALGTRRGEFARRLRRQVLVGMDRVYGDDTIAAIATSLGDGGLAVIRVSGPQAFNIADRVFRPAKSTIGLPSAFPTHTIHYGHVVEGDRPVDEVLMTGMRAPRSFTREDVVELSCHGGALVAEEVLRLTLAAGARLAEPGEFTRRAFLNGRIDLTQAEAVADIIRARTDRALSAANAQLAGGLSKRVETLRQNLISVLAHLEAHLDFPDEDIDPSSAEIIQQRLRDGASLIESLLATANQGRILRQGLRAAIVGRPNAGKSSLLNQLLDTDRAIVSEAPGTTRDTIEETANIRGLPIVFVDTAGIRETDDAIEREGVRRSREMMAQAELTLHVLDGSEPLSSDDRALLELSKDKPVIHVLNKRDLAHRLEGVEGILVSCRTGEGLEILRDRIHELALSGPMGEGSDVLINARHQDALRRALEGIEATTAALDQGLSLEFAALDLRLGLSAVGEIVGKTTTEDLLDQIFGEFCLGK